MYTDEGLVERTIGHSHTLLKDPDKFEVKNLVC